MFLLPSVPILHAQAAAPRPAVGLVWDLNPEDDIAGYRIHWGLEKGKYLRRIDVGNTNAARIELPLASRTYYFVATAYDTEGLESFYSNEVSTNAPPSEIAIRSESSRASTEEDRRVSLDLSSSVTTGPGEWLTIRAPKHGQIASEGGVLYYVPAPDFFGDDSFEIVIALESDTPVLWSWDIDVLDVREAPTAFDAWSVTDEDSPLTLILGGHDPDGGPLKFEILRGPGGELDDPLAGELVENLPEITFIPTSGFTGTATFQFVVANNTTSSPPARVTIEVIPAIQEPFISDMFVTLAENRAVKFRLAVGPAPGITYFFHPRTDHGTVSGVPPDLTYTPDPDFTSTDVLIVEASDTHGRTEIAVIYFEVTSVFEPPIAESFEVSTSFGTPVPIVLKATTPDVSTPLDFEVVDKPGNGAYTGVPPDLIYQPNTGFSGPDSLTYRAHDGPLASNLAVVKITVGPRPVPAPRIRTSVSAANLLTLRWEILAGRKYDVVFKDSLSNGTWIPITEPMVSEEEAMSWSVSLESSRPHGYYAVRLLPP